MAIEYRAAAPDELATMFELDRIGFGLPERVTDFPLTWAHGEPERTRCAFDGAEMIGGSRNYSFELTVPGGTSIPAAAVSWVSVLPTHRRRGVLTGMIDALHRDARDHEEPVAILTASESVIYGRFGYGIALWRRAISVERAHVRFVDDTDDGRMRFIGEDDAAKIFPPVYDAARRLRAGMVTRPDFWWPENMGWLAADEGPVFRVVHEAEDGIVDGYAAYGVKLEWNSGISMRRMPIFDLVSITPSARRALWRFLFGVDLVHTVTASNVPIDEPLGLMLTDPRRVRTDFVYDGMWLCILDEVQALESRTYATEGRLVFDVHRPDGSNASFVLEGGTGGATCKPTTEPADLALGTSQLSSVFLGGLSFREHYDAGRIDELTWGAVDRADAMFATSPPPAMISHF